MEVRWSLPAAEDLERVCERIERDNADAARVDLAYHMALGRPATAAEKSRGAKYVSDFQHEATYVTKDNLKTARTDAWASFCQALLGSAEFRYLN